MTSGKNSAAVEALQDNVSQFFDRFFEKHQSHMRCSNGCSSCCQSGLTVFPVEAERILNWWNELDSSSRERIKAQWTEALIEPAADASSKCVFLSGHSCSIYKARPVVCRSQGLPLKISVEKQNAENDVAESELSVCDLNFTEHGSLPEGREWLDLDRLNVLLTIAQRQWNENESALELKELNQKYQGRIPLTEIQALILHKLQ
jgi:uncharacterized protein